MKTASVTGLNLCHLSPASDVGFLGKDCSVDRAACRRFAGCSSMSYIHKEVKMTRQSKRSQPLIHLLLYPQI